MTEERAELSLADVERLVREGPPLVFLGYRVKQVMQCPDWLSEYGGHTAAVREICSVSDCLTRPPEDWVERGAPFNDAGCYDTEQAAWVAVPRGSESNYRAFAYSILPIQFDKSGVFSFRIRMELAEPDRRAFSSLGYDIAGAPLQLSANILGFDCSPLSCNGCAADWDVNEYCLLKDLNTAVKCAQSFAETEPEPGPFYVYEVLGKVVD